MTSLSDFERIYGSGEPLQFRDIKGPLHNYLAHAVRAFFKEGGKRCYVARIVNGSADKGGDGYQPDPAVYEGTETLVGGVKTRTGLRSFEDREDISIVAAPGARFDYGKVGGSFHAEAVAKCLISHCERMRYRVAVIDSVNGHDPGEVKAYRSTFDSSYAALYYPWLVTVDPLIGKKIEMPPNGSRAALQAASLRRHISCPVTVPR